MASGRVCWQLVFYLGLLDMSFRVLRYYHIFLYLDLPYCVFANGLVLCILKYNIILHVLCARFFFFCYSYELGVRLEILSYYVLLGTGEF